MLPPGSATYGWCDAEICNAIMPSGNQKRKDLAVLAKTPRLNRFFSCKTFKQQR